LEKGCSKRDFGKDIHWTGENSARAGKEVEGTCFLLRAFYKKVQNVADRIYLKSRVLEANILHL
jgi:hypothetical protein